MGLIVLLCVSLAHAVAPTYTPVVAYGPTNYPDSLSNMNSMRHHENQAAGTPLPGKITDSTGAVVMPVSTLTPAPGAAGAYVHVVSAPTANIGTMPAVVITSLPTFPPVVVAAITAMPTFSGVVSGAVTANQGTPGPSPNPWPVGIGSGGVLAPVSTTIPATGAAGVYVHVVSAPTQPPAVIAAVTALPNVALTLVPTVVVQVVQTGAIPTPTYVSYLTLTIGTSITPVAGATATAKRIKVKRGKWTPGGGGLRIRECNSTGTPGPEISNIEAVFTSPAECAIQKWYIPIATTTPSTIDFEFVETP